MFTVHGCGTVPEINPCTWKLFKKLLRVLQEGEFERVGEDVTRKVDVRVIAATNQNLAEQVRARQFREDLFYRLNVLPLALPPLRARPDDIPLLAAHAIEDVSKRLRIQAPSLTQADVARLRQYDWPGNVRELENVLQRAVILSKGVRLRGRLNPWCEEDVGACGHVRLQAADALAERIGVAHEVALCSRGEQHVLTRLIDRLTRGTDACSGRRQIVER